jgi:hypothetical protein
MELFMRHSFRPGILLLCALAIVPTAFATHLTVSEVDAAESLRLAKQRPWLRGTGKRDHEAAEGRDGELRVRRDVQILLPPVFATVGLEV